MLQNLNILDKKWYGGLYHLYNTNDSWDQWVNDFESEYSYPAHIIEKFTKVIKNNHKHIINKNVIDLACNLGYLSLACSNIGATKVVGIECREEYTNTFLKIYQHWENKNIEMLTEDLTDLNNLQERLQNIDTILYTGHFYHTIQHRELLNAFTKSNATCLILESIEPPVDTDNIYNGVERVDNPLNGFTKGQEFIKFGIPSVTQTKNMLLEFGWNIIQIEYIELYTPKRFVITAIIN